MLRPYEQDFSSSAAVIGSYSLEFEKRKAVPAVNGEHEDFRCDGCSGSLNDANLQS
jgi:hypothetical protein